MSRPLQVRAPRADLNVPSEALQDDKEYAKVCLFMEADLHRRWKGTCVADGVSMTAIMSELVLEWMERRKGPK